MLALKAYIRKKHEKSKWIIIDATLETTESEFNLKRLQDKP